MFIRSTTKLKALSLLILTVFASSTIAGDAFAAVAGLPVPGTMVMTSTAYSMPVLKALKIDVNNPFNLDFIIDSSSAQKVSKEEASKLVNYFLAALAVDKKDIWVNLSPYEQERITDPNLAITDLGKDLLKQDYILKQLSASLTHPDTPLGKTYWSMENGKSTIENDMSKIWIVPEQASIYEADNTAYITNLTFDVETESQVNASSALNGILTQVRKEVNDGENFANLRQIFHSIVLAEWFKAKLKDSVFKHYINQNKVEGIDIEDKTAKDKIWAQYVESFQKGAYNTVTKVKDSYSGRIQKQKFFAGGVTSSSLEVEEESDINAVDWEGAAFGLGVELTDPNKEISYSGAYDSFLPAGDELGVSNPLGKNREPIKYGMIYDETEESSSALTLRKAKQNFKKVKSSVDFVESAIFVYKTKGFDYLKNLLGNYRNYNGYVQTMVIAATNPELMQRIADEYPADGTLYQKRIFNDSEIFKMVSSSKSSSSSALTEEEAYKIFESKAPLHSEMVKAIKVIFETNLYDTNALSDYIADPNIERDDEAKALISRVVASMDADIDAFAKVITSVPSSDFLSLLTVTEGTRNKTILETAKLLDIDPYKAETYLEDQIFTYSPRTRSISFVDLDQPLGRVSYGILYDTYDEMVDTMYENKRLLEKNLDEEFIRFLNENHQELMVHWMGIVDKQGLLKLVEHAKELYGEDYSVASKFTIEEKNYKLLDKAYVFLSSQEFTDLEPQDQNEVIELANERVNFVSSSLGESEVNKLREQQIVTLFAGQKEKADFLKEYHADIWASWMNFRIPTLLNIVILEFNKIYDDLNFADDSELQVAAYDRDRTRLLEEATDLAVAVDKQNPSTSSAIANLGIAKDILSEDTLTYLETNHEDLLVYWSMLQNQDSVVILAEMAKDLYVMSTKKINQDHVNDMVSMLEDATYEFLQEESDAKVASSATARVKKRSKPVWTVIQNQIAKLTDKSDTAMLEFYQDWQEELGDRLDDANLSRISRDNHRRALDKINDIVNSYAKELQNPLVNGGIDAETLNIETEAISSSIEFEAFDPTSFKGFSFIITKFEQEDVNTILASL